MTLAVVGTETWEASGNGAKTRGLTIPAGAVGFTIGVSLPYNDSISAVSIGGVSVTIHGKHTQNVVGADMLSCADITGRTNDTLSYTQSGTSGGAAWRYTVTYYSGGVLAFEQYNWDDTGGSGNLTDSFTVPAGSPDGKFICAIAWLTYNYDITNYIPSAGSTAIFAGAVGTRRGGGGYTAVLTGTTSVGANMGTHTPQINVVVMLAVYDAAVVIAPVTPGALSGPPASFTVTQGDPMVVANLLGIARAAVGIPVGFTITADGPAQVMLGVPKAERPQMTEGGDEGQVLTRHALSKPTWADPTLLLTGVSSHTLTADTDDLAISATASQILLTSTGGPWTLSGMTNGVIGRVVTMQNQGLPVTLLENDAGSAVGNRFGNDSALNLVIPQWSAVLVVYLSNGAGTNFWRVIGVLRSHDHSDTAAGSSLSPATLILPAATSPAQTAEGSVVWDSDDDKLTIGDGASRKTFVPQVTGSWTPGIAFGGGVTGLTYSVRTGTYVKQGKLVTASFIVTLSAKGSSTGTATLTGLPFTSANSGARGAGAVGYLSAMASLNSVPSLLVDQNATTCIFWQLNAADGTATGLIATSEANFTDTTQINGSITYEAA